jgi:hypothetical protein
VAEGFRDFSGTRRRRFSKWEYEMSGAPAKGQRVDFAKPFPISSR